MPSAFLSALFIANLSCSTNWSRFNEDTIAFLSTNENNICVDFCNYRSQALLFQQCFDFNEKVEAQTIFNHQNSTYLLSRSKIDNALLLTINNETKLFSYNSNKLKFNIFTETIFEYSNNGSLKQYNISNFISAVLNKTDLLTLSEILLPADIEDYDFLNNTIYFYKNGKTFIESYHFANSDCLPFIYQIEPCSYKNEEVSLAEKMFLFLLLPIIACIAFCVKFLRKKYLQGKFIKRKNSFKQEKSCQHKLLFTKRFLA